ncbi:MAG: prepilin-type N-terminal cleavage/methylation domain-containing protein [Clostridiaceae bacterium]|nr:prepilin-type N-terminal cleavage/methylation domain-containing protein [Clostridiaceae bacterium]
MRSSVFTTIMRNNTVKKLNNKKGVTLIELLVTVVLLVLVTGIITLAIDLGVRSFKKSNREAEGQILCAALATSVKDELRYAKNITGTDLSTLKFFSTNLSLKNCSFSITDQDGIPVAENESGFLMLSTPLGLYDLVPKKTYVYDLKANLTIEFELLDEDSDQPKPTFKVGIQVVAQEGTNEITISEENFVVEPLN